MTHPILSAHIREQGLFDCFEQGLTDADGEIVNAEIPAVVHDGKKLLMASDKPVPGRQRADIFAVPYRIDSGFADYEGDGVDVSYYTLPEIENAVKNDRVLTVEGVEQTFTRQLHLAPYTIVALDSVGSG